MKGYLSISEIAVKYAVSDSTARRKMCGVKAAKLHKEGTHIVAYYAGASVREAFGNESAIARIRRLDAKQKK